jgi:hypothetical protein
MATFSSTVADPADYLPPAPAQVSAPMPAASPTIAPGASGGANMADRVERVVMFVSDHGFVFDPWQVAAYISAVRTKPFVILAGISGTGKTRLPELVAAATEAKIVAVPVRPDWTDSSDLIGYERLNGSFMPGPLLMLAEEAVRSPRSQFFILLDEMNVARVEYYLAEVLSRLEQRQRVATGRFLSAPLLPPADPSAQKDPAAAWRGVGLPSNLCVVGSVNMDETTHGFSKKVLDRSFVIEFSDVDLRRVGVASSGTSEPWNADDWQQAALTLAEHPKVGAPVVMDVIETLSTLNEILTPIQLQVGYRVRDEVAMFCLIAQECAGSFTTSTAGTVDALDLAVAMKVLPRLQGGGASIKKALGELKEWSNPTASSTSPRAFPFCEARIDLMRLRLEEAGFTSYWL